MLLSRTRFLLLVWIALLSPLVLYKVIWLAGSKKTKGVVSFQGKAYTGQFMRTYSVINFPMGGADSAYFNSPDNMLFEKGTVLDVYYHPGDPESARVGDFAGLFNDLFIPGIVITVLMTLIALHKEIIPYGSRILLSRRKPRLTVYSAGE